MAAPRCLAGQWHGCLDTANGVVLVTFVTMPLSALVVVEPLARRRRRRSQVLRGKAESD